MPAADDALNGAHTIIRTIGPTGRTSCWRPFSPGSRDRDTATRVPHAAHRNPDSGSRPPRRSGRRSWHPGESRRRGRQPGLDFRARGPRLDVRIAMNIPTPGQEKRRSGADLYAHPLRLPPRGPTEAGVGRNGRCLPARSCGFPLQSSACRAPSPSGRPAWSRVSTLTRTDMPGRIIALAGHP